MTVILIGGQLLASSHALISEWIGDQHETMVLVDDTMNKEVEDSEEEKDDEITPDNFFISNPIQAQYASVHSFMSCLQIDDPREQTPPPE